MSKTFSFLYSLIILSCVLYCGICEKDMKEKCCNNSKKCVWYYNEMGNLLKLPIHYH